MNIRKENISVKVPGVVHMSERRLCQLVEVEEANSRPRTRANVSPTMVLRFRSRINKLCLFPMIQMLTCLRSKTQEIDLIHSNADRKSLQISDISPFKDSICLGRVPLKAFQKHRLGVIVGVGKRKPLTQEKNSSVMVSG